MITCSCTLSIVKRLNVSSVDPACIEQRFQFLSKSARTYKIQQEIDCIIEIHKLLSDDPEYLEVLISPSLFFPECALSTEVE